IVGLDLTCVYTDPHRHAKRPDAVADRASAANSGSGTFKARQHVVRDCVDHLPIVVRQLLAHECEISRLQITSSTVTQRNELLRNTGQVGEEKRAQYSTPHLLARIHGSKRWKIVRQIRHHELENTLGPRKVFEAVRTQIAQFQSFD